MHLSQPGRHHHHIIIVRCHATGCRADYQSVLEVRAALRRASLVPHYRTALQSRRHGGQHPGCCARRQ